MHLLALTSLALFAFVHVNAGLVADRAQVARLVHNRDVIAKRKRDPSTCVPRPTSSSTPTPTPTSTPPSPPASSTSSTYTAPSATPSNGSNNGSKKWGLAWGGDPAFLQNFDLPGVGYIYNWSPTLPTNIPQGIIGIPMLWGYRDVGDWSSIVVEGYSTIAFAINEPNEPGQANMTPQEAVSVWMTNMQPLRALNYQLVGPACTDDDDGLTWYSEFFSACYAAGCTFDALGLHGYNTDAQTIIDYATTLHQTYGLPIYISEYADQNFSGTGDQADMNEVWDFAGKMRDFVENTPWIVAAFPFGVMGDLQGVNTDNALLTSDGYPTDLAYFYFGSPN